MWYIEIGYRYTNIVSRLAYDTREEAQKERDKLVPELGKDRFSNDKQTVVCLEDKHGTNDIVCGEVKTIRLINIESWAEDMAKIKNIEEKIFAEKGGKIK